MVAEVHYHLTIPRDLYFLLNPTGRLHLDYEEYLGGFILVAVGDAEKIALDQYTLELSDKRKRTIQVERRYKKRNVQGKDQISFWVKVVNDELPQS